MHDKQHQRFERLVAERRRELGHEPPREDVRAILNQIERERAAELKAMVANADNELGEDDLEILDGMGVDNDDDEPGLGEALVDDLDEGPS